MKTNELMIGDWVSAGYNSKVTGIDLNTDAIRIAGNIGWFKTNEHEPIPITPEILEANGFLIDDEDWFVWERRSGIYTLAEVKLYQEDDVWHAALYGPEVCEIDDLNIRFVHDLQHAMRLIGLHDFADNFVIKKGGQQ
ncbi:MAG: hypothetical protein IK135_02605 [Bacteroidales bacterium]|nr:hypothetical protein [Bacteroidales bacterium]